MPSTSKVNQPLTITCNFKNTLPIPLTNIKFSVESLGLNNMKSWEQEWVLVPVIDFCTGVSYTCATLLRYKLLGCYSKDVDTYCWCQVAEKVTLITTLPAIDLLLLVRLVVLQNCQSVPVFMFLFTAQVFLLALSCYLFVLPFAWFSPLGSHFSY